MPIEFRLTASIKVSPFWEQILALWFAPIGSQFALHRITNDAFKFN